MPTYKVVHFKETKFELLANIRLRRNGNFCFCFFNLEKTKKFTTHYLSIFGCQYYITILCYCYALGFVSGEFAFQEPTHEVVHFKEPNFALVANIKLKPRGDICFSIFDLKRQKSSHLITFWSVGVNVILPFHFVAKSKGLSLASLHFRSQPIKFYTLRSTILHYSQILD